MPYIKYIQGAILITLVILLSISPLTAGTSSKYHISCSPAEKPLNLPYNFSDFGTRCSTNADYRGGYHPSVIFIPDGWGPVAGQTIDYGVIHDTVAANSPRWAYWMAYSADDSCRGGGEETYIAASDGGDKWVIPYFVCTGGSTHDSVFFPGNRYTGSADVESVYPNDSLGGRSTDPDLIFDTDNRLRLYWRAIHPALFSDDTVVIWTMASENGVVWRNKGSLDDMAVPAYSRVEKRCQHLMSPSVVGDSAGAYLMYVVDDCDDDKETPWAVLRYKSDYPDRGWYLLDTCTWDIDGIAHKLSDDSIGVWHLDINRCGGDYHAFVCVNSLHKGFKFDSQGLYFAVSHDGRVFDICPKRVLGRCPGWMSGFIYRASAIARSQGPTIEYDIFYSAFGRGRFKIGRTSIEIR